MPSGNVRILINDDESKAPLRSSRGKLLNVLADNKVFVSSACGGGGTCAQCKVNIYEGGGDILQDRDQPHYQARGARGRAALLSGQRQAGHGDRSAARSVLGQEVGVRSSSPTTTWRPFIKEFIVKLPEGETLDFQPGGFIQIEVPPFECDFKDFEGIEERFHPDWDRFKVWDFKAVNTEPVFRAYSNGQSPGRGRHHHAQHPHRHSAAQPRKGWLGGCAAGHCLFLCVQPQAGRQGDDLGPLRRIFHPRHRPRNGLYRRWRWHGTLCARIYTTSSHTLKTERKVSYWYGARNPNEVFYEDHFRKIEEEFPNFTFHIAMSEPRPEDNWDGYVGFIHQVVYDHYLRTISPLKMSNITCAARRSCSEPRSGCSTI